MLRQQKMSINDLYRYCQIPCEEYPELDVEQIVDYPVDFGEVDPAQIWAKRDMCVFIHIPFCNPPCDYCFFLRYPDDEELRAAYLVALKKEIDFYARMPYVQDRVVRALYFGGGTPTILSVEQFEDLIDHIRSRFEFAHDAEIEVEVHPLHAEREKLEMLRAKGVARLSFGVQAFEDNLLQLAGSALHGEDSIRALKRAHEIGFPKIGLDLMLNMPDQTTEDWIHSLETALSLNPSSISCIRFTILPYAPIARRASRLKFQTPEEAYELWLETFRRLNAHGYQPYTVTCFGKPGGESKYVLGVWQPPQLEVLGCGAGAISSAIREHIYINISVLEEYIRTVHSGRLPVMVGQKMSATEQMSRYVILGLRTLEVSKDEFFELFGCRLDEVYAEQMEYLRERELIVDDEHTLRLSSPWGIWYAGNVSKRFFTPNNVRKPQPVGPLYTRVALPKAVSESSLQFDTLIPPPILWTG